jgi:hypothetical protein
LSSRWPSFPGEAGLETTRIEAVFTAVVPRSEAGNLTFRNEYAADRLGWREIVVTNGTGIVLEGADDLGFDRSDAPRIYSDALLSSPLDERSVSVRFRVSPGAVARTGTTDSGTTGSWGINERLGEIVNGATLSTSGAVLALLAAAAWGAVHALSPGHGKTVVGAYLVGSRGTPRHAHFLGSTVMFIHTAGMIALGLVILFASKTIMPEQLYPWLTLVSGLMVAAIGAAILR